MILLLLLLPLLLLLLIIIKMIIMIMIMITMMMINRGSGQGANPQDLSPVSATPAPQRARPDSLERLSSEKQWVLTCVYIYIYIYIWYFRELPWRLFMCFPWIQRARPSSLERLSSAGISCVSFSAIISTPAKRVLRPAGTWYFSCQQF